MSHKRKLIYIVTKSSWGGAQRYVYDLAKSYKNKFEVEIWCGNNELATSISLEEKATTSGIKVRKIRGLARDIKIFGDLIVLNELRKLIKNEKPEILHLNSSKIGLFGAIIGKLYKIDKIVYTAHGLANFEERPTWQKFLISLANQAIFFLADSVILISKKEFDYTKHWRSRRKHIMIHNGIEPIKELPKKDIINELPDTIKKKFKNRDIKKYVGIGELHKNKGLEYSLTALKHHLEYDSNFVYVHFGTGELKEQLENLVTKYQLENHVYLFGFKENASAYLKYFDALIFPSIKEGLPYVVIEAGFAGLQTFASRAGGIPEIITEGLNGQLHDVKDVNTLAKQLITFIKTTSHERKKIKEITEEHFSIQKMKILTSEIYKD